MLFTLSVASALVALVAAQSASTTVSQSMPPSATASFNPNNVSSSDAFLWCHAQLNTCPEICGGAASVNTCDDTTFTYSCICSNGTEPDVTAYQQTLPFFICQATFSQCINNHPNDAEGQTTCKSDEKCGTLNATAANSASSSSSSAAASSTSASQTSASSTGSASASAASASHSSIANNQQLATGAFAAILVAAFKLFL
jgi:cobalamin biosynthesis Mg chelatase CobN